MIVIGRGESPQWVWVSAAVVVPVGVAFSAAGNILGRFRV